MTVSITPQSSFQAISGSGRRLRNSSLQPPPSRLPSLRSLSIPRFALRRSEVAASLGISESLFDDWVKKGRMPRPRRIDGVVLWDTRKVAAAWDALADEDGRSNPFDRVVV